MALEQITAPEERPTLYKVLLSFGTALDGAKDYCEDEASARFLLGTSFLKLAQDLEMEFGDIDINKLTANVDEAPFVHVEDPSDPIPPLPEAPQIPIMARPMQALILILRDSATNLLNGGFKENPIEKAYFQLKSHQEQFPIASAGVVETLIQYVKPLKDQRFKAQSIAEEQVSRFAETVADLITTDTAPESLHLATGPNQALIAHAVAQHFPKAPHTAHSTATDESGDTTHRTSPLGKAA